MKNEDPRKSDAHIVVPSIDIKGVKKPDEYGGDEKGFPLWYSRFKGLLTNRFSSTSRGWRKKASLPEVWTEKGEKRNGNEVRGG